MEFLAQFIVSVPFVMFFLGTPALLIGLQKR